MRGPRPTLLLAVLTIALALTSAAPALASWPAPVPAPAHRGFNPADMDRSVDPGDDFVRYASGGWLDRTEIPAAKERYGAIEEVQDATTDQLVALFERLAAAGDFAPGSDEWKAVELYRQGIDQTARDEQGIEPIRPILDEIAEIDDAQSLHAFQEGAAFRFLTGLFTVYGWADLADASVNAPYLSGPYLGLPARDFYVSEDPAYEPVREAYVVTCARLLELAGVDPAAARADAEAVFALERALAEPTATIEEQQDYVFAYNPMTIGELEQAYPLMDWAGFVATLGLTNVERLIAIEPRYLAALDGIVRRTPVTTLKSYLVLEALWSFADYLDGEIAATAFAFDGTILGGVTEREPLEQRVIDQLDGMVGEAVGKLYVAEHFPPEAKAEIEALVAEIVAAFRVRLEQNARMSPETRLRAIAKLDAMRVKVGYPDQWRSYAAVEVGDSYAMSFLSAFRVDYRRMLDGIGRPVDKAAWPTNPQTVNAFYVPTNNEIVFPAAVLQAPFFDYRADPASNFGAIGVLIGHEITHGFDLAGSQLDGEGNLVDWWTEEDRARFEALNQRVAAQYSAIEVLPGLFVDGERTVTENVADLGGVQVAFAALERHLALHGDPGPIDGFSQAQRFFLAGATIGREQVREEALITQIRTDWHAPLQVRALQALRNTDAFYDAFGIGPGDPMYLPPSDRIVVW
jgi:putative endopeptidase